jgi:hypothetical protein
MVKRQTALKIRKTHRYLGLFIGIQFIMWTVSGLYFSWTDIDEIHGDDFRKEHVQPVSFANLQSPNSLVPGTDVSSLQLKDIAGNPYYFVNENSLVNARTGEERTGINQEEALLIAKKNMKEGLTVKGIERIEETGKHHEFRGGPFPAYVISYDTPKNLKAYISVKDGSFRSVRFRDWRWFDFLWMTHTMDYEGRDDFNNIILRIFSLMGLITVLSGFVLWYVSSPTIFKFRKRIRK